MTEIKCVYYPKCSYTVPIFDQTAEIMELHIREVHRKTDGTQISQQDHMLDQKLPTSGSESFSLEKDGVPILSFSKKKVSGRSGKITVKYKCEETECQVRFISVLIVLKKAFVLDKIP